MFFLIYIILCGLCVCQGLVITWYTIGCDSFSVGFDFPQVSSDMLIWPQLSNYFKRGTTGEGWSSTGEEGDYTCGPWCNWALVCTFSGPFWGPPLALKLPFDPWSCLILFLSWRKLAMMSSREESWAAGLWRVVFHKKSSMPLLGGGGRRGMPRTKDHGKLSNYYSFGDS